MKTTNKRKLVFLWAIFSLILSHVAYAQERKVSGKITGADDNLPIPGVSVSVKGNQKGTSTDVNGQFIITAKTGDILVFRAIGYQSQEKSLGEASVINIALKSETSNLDEVVVIGYGVQKKKLTTGANLQVKGDDIQKQSSTSVLQALQGQTPGMQITSSSGQPGSGMNVTIRGKGTIGYKDASGNFVDNSGPLYVVDGLVGVDISTINPADIESIDVLKDAASAAIYGSNSANGVILVTTKTGKKGKRTSVTFDAYTGTQQVARMADLLNAKEYAAMMNEAAINSGKSPIFTPDSIAALGQGTNWLDEMFVKNAATKNYVFGIQGSSAASVYSTSLSYTGQEGIVGGKDLSNYGRYNLRINTEHNLYKEVIKFGQHLNFVYTKNNGIGVGGLYNNSLRSAFSTSPFLKMYDDEGNFFNNDIQGAWNRGEANPYAEMVYNNQNRNNKQNLFGDIYASVSPIKGLTFRTSFGFKYESNEGNSFSPTYHLSQYSFRDINAASQSMGKNRTLQFDNLLTYKFDLEKANNFEVMAGSSSISTDVSNLFGSNQDLVFTDLDHAYVTNALSKDGAVKNLSGSAFDFKQLSYFGRLQYNYKETYLLNATLRADGSSNFAKGQRWGYFPSFSGGWVASNEAFLANTRNWLDFLKVRASWGRVGNQNIARDQYLATVLFINTNYSFGNGEGVSTLVPGAFPDRLANELIKWETSEQTNIGFDARFLRGKLNANFDYYIKNTKDWLVEAPILNTAGARPPVINGGDVKNSGVELALNYSSNIGKFNYSVGANGAYNKNRVGNIPTLDKTIHGNLNALYVNALEFYRAENDYPIGYFRGYKTAGIFQTEAEVATYRSTSGKVIQPTAAPGDVRFVDLDDNGVINDADKTMIGDPNPHYIYGLNFSANYKGFDFYVLASGVAGNQIIQSWRNPSSSLGNYSAAILDRWHGPGSSNRMPRVTEDNRNFAQISDLYVQDGDFLRISNVTLGYDFSKLFNKSYLGKVRLYAAALNLFTFTKYDGMDPEIGYGEGFSSGVDVGYYPRPRTFMLGANVRF